MYPTIFHIIPISHSHAQKVAHFVQPGNLLRRISETADLIRCEMTTLIPKTGERGMKNGIWNIAFLSALV
jgi:hypothetical protein